MFATDFTFDGRRASEMDLMICSFDGVLETASGGEIEYNVVKSPGRDSFTFYGSQFNSVLTWNFSICKNPRRTSNLYFDQYEESRIAKWLIRTDGYKYLQFDQPGYEDIFYKAYINAVPRQINGQTVGFDLVATSNCAYGFTDVIKRNETFNSSAPLLLNIHSDVNTYIFPKIKLKGSGNFNIDNYKDENFQDSLLDKPMEFKNVSANTEIFIDSNFDIITGLSNPNNFNWCFLVLADGKNFITTSSNSNIEIELQYREPRLIKI